jgi:hypothetical protein
MMDVFSSSLMSFSPIISFSKNDLRWSWLTGAYTLKIMRYLFCLVVVLVDSFNLQVEVVFCGDLLCIFCVSRILWLLSGGS